MIDSNERRDSRYGLRRRCDRARPRRPRRRRRGRPDGRPRRLRPPETVSTGRPPVPGIHAGAQRHGDNQESCEDRESTKASCSHLLPPWSAELKVLVALRYFSEELGRRNRIECVVALDERLLGADDLELVSDTGSPGVVGVHVGPRAAAGRLLQVHAQRVVITGRNAVDERAGSEEHQVRDRRLHLQAMKIQLEAVRGARRRVRKEPLSRGGGDADVESSNRVVVRRHLEPIRSRGLRRKGRRP